MTTNEAEILLRVVDVTILQEFSNHNPYIDFGRARYAIQQPSVVMVCMYLYCGGKNAEAKATAAWEMKELSFGKTLGDFMKIVRSRIKDAIDELCPQEPE